MMSSNSSVRNRSTGSRALQMFPDDLNQKYQLDTVPLDVRAVETKLYEARDNLFQTTSTVTAALLGPTGNRPSTLLSLGRELTQCLGVQTFDVTDEISYTGIPVDIVKNACDNHLFL